MMETVIFLFLRRMRGPLLVVLAAYAISIGGLVLIPGQDDQGNIWYFDFFHAFYFVSIMGPTIGFGEIPYDFTPAQRAWVTFTIYLTVLSWLYAIGRIFALLQDPPFIRALTEARFIRAVRFVHEPFYIVCGYGETGSLLVRSMVRRGIQPVVIDLDQDRINTLTLEDLGRDVPSFCGDASDPKHLIEAGLKRSLCQGVVVVTDNDEANVAISVASKLLVPDLKVITRAGLQETVSNLDSFNTDHVINAFEVFGEHLAMALKSPTLHMLHIWLVSRAGNPLAEKQTPPEGRWVICGWGRFGSRLGAHLNRAGCETTVIESNPDKAPEGAVIGPGTEAEPLQKAQIETAVAVVAGTGSDINNLSVLMTASELNADLYRVARLDRRRNAEIFQAAKIDLIMQSSRIVVWRILPLLTTPLLSRFLRLMRTQTEDKAEDLGRRISDMTYGLTPETWLLKIDDRSAPALVQHLAQGGSLQLDDLLRKPDQREERFACIPLLVVRGGQDILLPESELTLQQGDSVLLCSQVGVEKRMARVLYQSPDLHYVLTGVREADGALWRFFTRRAHVEQSE